MKYASFAVLATLFAALPAFGQWSPWETVAKDENVTVIAFQIPGILGGSESTTLAVCFNVPIKSAVVIANVVPDGGPTSFVLHTTVGSTCPGGNYPIVLAELTSIIYVINPESLVSAVRRTDRPFRYSPRATIRTGTLVINWCSTHAESVWCQ